MHRRHADAGNWQARGQEFAVGQDVRLVGSGDTAEGRVVAVYPAIGMVDVQWPHTANRHPVEDLQILSAGDDPMVGPMHEDVPGGPGIGAEVSDGAAQGNVIEGQDPHIELVRAVGGDDPSLPELDHARRLQGNTQEALDRIARQFVKRSLYWHARDRKYRVSRQENESGSYRCPACSGTLRRATYKMENGQVTKLHACPSCLFMIRTADILADHCSPEEETG